MERNVAIIGAGAAGCLCAIELKGRCPDVSVTLFEALARPLVKVARTGGGRCNLTNSFAGATPLKAVYPRGERLMRRLLHAFGPQDTMRWFEERGVALVEEDGGRIFPASGEAAQVVSCLQRQLLQGGVRLRCNAPVARIVPLEDGTYEVLPREGSPERFDAVIVTTGGSPRSSGLGFLSPLGVDIIPPVPSLFTLRLDEAPLKALMGTVAPEAVLSIPGTSLRAAAPLLITDWGLGGPATLKLSSYAARLLAERAYRSPLAVNWTGLDESSIREALQQRIGSAGRRKAANTPLPGLSERLWTYLLARSGAREDIRWAEFGSKGLNRLVNTLTNDPYRTSGRAAFQEEFVTCGGVSLEQLDADTMGLRAHPGIYFAGEVTDIDAVTGGFNLQAAWTTGWVCARSAARYLSEKG